MSNAARANRSVIDPASFSFKSVRLYGAATGKDGWDIKDLIQEMIIKESVKLSSLVYEFTLIDSANAFERLKISGNERIEIELVKPGIGGSEVYNLTCYVVDIPMFGKPNSNSYAYKLSAVSKHAYIGSIERISKPFEGSFINVVRDLYQGDLETEVSHFDSNSSGSVKGIFPNILVKDAVQMLLDRAVDEHGSPFYVFETIANGVHIESHNSLLSNHLTENKYLDGFFFTADTPLVASDDPKFKEYFNQKKFRILSVDSKLGMSKLNAMTRGSVASDTIEVDSASKQYQHYQYRYQPVDDTLGGRTVYDPDFTLKNKKLPEYTNVVSTLVNKNSMAYGDINAYNSAIAPSTGKLKSVAGNIDNITQVITLCGDVELHSGCTIEIQLPKPIDPALNEKSVAGLEGYIDEYMSGKYLVVSVNHKFNQDGHYMSVQLKRDTLAVDIKEGLKG